MNIIDKIDLILGECDGGGGEGSPSTTTSDIAKVPIGTKKMKKKKKKADKKMEE